MAKYDGGKRVKVKYESGHVSFLSEKAAKILQDRKELKILGDAPAPEVKAESKGK